MLFKHYFAQILNAKLNVCLQVLCTYYIVLLCVILFLFGFGIVCLSVVGFCNAKRSSQYIYMKRSRGEKKATQTSTFAFHMHHTMTMYLIKDALSSYRAQCDCSRLAFFSSSSSSFFFFSVQLKKRIAIGRGRRSFIVSHTPSLVMQTMQK